MTIEIRRAGTGFWRTTLLGCLLALVSIQAHSAEIARAARWDLHSGFWMSLHQTLMHDASIPARAALQTLDVAQRRTWDEAVVTYRRHVGAGHITFSDVMMHAQDDVAQIDDDAVSPQIDGPLADALRAAAPVYRRHWWPADDHANRFFIGYAAAMLNSAGEELAQAHEAVYGSRLPRRIRVYASPYAGRFGAYTHELPRSGLNVIIASRDNGNQGLAALEIVLHESSHGIVGPRYGSVAKAIADASKELGIEVPRDLWHAILFATTSRLTQRALAERGHTAFVPSAEDLLTRVWPQYRGPIETHWHPYLAGHGTLPHALARVVAATR